MNTIFDNFTGEVNLDIFRPGSEIPGASIRRQYLSLVGLLQYVDIINGDLTGTLPANITEQTVKGMISHCIGDLKVREEMSKEPTPVEQPDDEIWYTSTDGNVIEPTYTDGFGANIISNTYEKGKGVIKFDGPVTQIGTEAFLYCSTLNSISIPNSVTSIGTSAFASTRIESIYIPDSVTSIGENAFGECWITSIEIGLGVENIDDDAFFDTGLKSLVIPDNVMSIGAGVCYRCGNLTSVTIGAGVESFGDTEGGFAYFGQCDNLESIIVDQNNTVYDSRDNCNAIVETSTNTLIAGCKDTIIPDSVTSIGTMAFSECYKLSSIIIPNNITSIGYSAFDQCSELFSITSLNTTPPTLGEYVFSDISEDYTIYVPAESVDTYKTAWSDYADHITAIVEDENEPEEEPGE